MRRVAAILAFVACVLSGAGVSRAVHMVVAHGGGSCASERAPMVGGSCGHSGHDGHSVHVHHAAQGGPAGRATSALPSDIHDCPVCDELSLAGGCPALATPFTDVIALLAIAHDREASLLPAPCAPEACAARPPPSRA